MYKVTVRDIQHNIITERVITEPPGKDLFDELSREVGCDCYVDVCRLESQYNDGYALFFEEEVEFELIPGTEELEEFENE